MISMPETGLNSTACIPLRPILRDGCFRTPITPMYLHFQREQLSSRMNTSFYAVMKLYFVNTFLTSPTQSAVSISALTTAANLYDYLIHRERWWILFTRMIPHPGLKRRTAADLLSLLFLPTWTMPFPKTGVYLQAMGHPARET